MFSSILLRLVVVVGVLVRVAAMKAPLKQHLDGFGELRLNI